MARGRPDYDVWSAPVRYTPTQGLELYVLDFNIPKNTPQTTPAVYKLTAKGYNLDDTYDHTFYIRVWLMKGA